MSTFTKERIANLLQFNSEGSDCQANAEQWEVHELARIALASLEAEAVAYIFKHPAGRLFWALTDESNKGQSDVMPVYTAPPSPVSVPAAMEMDDDFDSAFEHGKAVGWNAYRAAMLQGSDGTLTNEGTITATQFKPVADLYGLTSPTGGETSFTFDAVEARDFIDGGWSCQEYVELESFQEAVSGNSPVIPEGWVACSERMPEPKRWLALYGARVFTHGDERGQPYHKSCVDQGYLGSDGQFYLLNWDQPGTLDDNYNNDLAIATHWMYWELPAPPQQEAKP